MSVDVKQQIKIRGGHRAYVSKLLKRVPEVAPDDEEQIELLRIPLKGKLSVLEDLDKSRKATLIGKLKNRRATKMKFTLTYSKWIHS